MARLGGGGYDYSAGTHAEGVNAPSAGLGHEGICGGRKIFPPALLTVVLDLINEVLGMLQPHADCHIPGLNVITAIQQEVVDIVGTVPGGKDDGAAEITGGGGDTRYLITFPDESRNPCGKPYFPAMGDYRLSYVLDYPGKLFSSDVRMGFIEDRGIGTMLTEEREHPEDITPLVRAGVELSVGEGSCTAFTERIVRFRVEYPFPAESRGVPLSGVNIHSPFQDDGSPPLLQEGQGGKESGRACTDHDTVPAAGRGEECFFEGFIYFIPGHYPDSRIDLHILSSRVNTLSDKPYSCDVPLPDACLSGGCGLQFLRNSCLTGRQNHVDVFFHDTYYSSHLPLVSVMKSP